MNIRQTFEQALEHRKAGQSAEAELLCRQTIEALTIDPTLLEEFGTLAMEMGWSEAAASLFGRAAEIAPEPAPSFSSLGRALTNLGRLEEAVAACRHAIHLAPNLAEAHHHLGVALGTQGQLDEAVAALQQAIRLRPAYAEAHNNLGIAFRTQGRLEEAVLAYRRAAQVRPENVEALNDMGNVLEKLGRLDEAIGTFRKAIQIKPDDADLYNNLGIALGNKGQMNGAIEAYRRATQLNPSHVDAYNNLGNALGRLGNLDEAQAACHQALEVNPQDALAKFNSGKLHLLAGELERGWPLCEERWNISDFASSRRDFPQPRWDGAALQGRTLLIHEEQGFGDCIQFIRYAPLVAACGGTVIVECPRPLLEVFATVKGIDQLVVSGDPLPPFDVHLPLMSLPLVFETTIETIPQNTPYLTADPARCLSWRDWFDNVPSRLKVGLTWAGRTDTFQRSLRAIHLRQLLPLFRVPGVDFVSVQLGNVTEQIAQLPGRQPIRHPLGLIADFADTAALISQLDLVISIDTAVAHLAGALGKPVWVLLPFAADWRWLLDRDDSPWYPTMRLFRQTRLTQWDPVVAEVRRALQALADGQS